MRRRKEREERKLGGRKNGEGYRIFKRTIREEGERRRRKKDEMF